jgi:hypothetical protein
MAKSSSKRAVPKLRAGQAAERLRAKLPIQKRVLAARQDRLASRKSR